MFLSKFVVCFTLFLMNRVMYVIHMLYCCILLTFTVCTCIVGDRLPPERAWESKNLLLSVVCCVVIL